MTSCCQRITCKLEVLLLRRTVIPSLNSPYSRPQQTSHFISDFFKKDTGTAFRRRKLPAQMPMARGTATPASSAFGVPANPGVIYLYSWRRCVSHFLMKKNDSGVYPASQGEEALRIWLREIKGVPSSVQPKARQGPHTNGNATTPPSGGAPHSRIRVCINLAVLGCASERDAVCQRLINSKLTFSIKEITGFRTPFRSVYHLNQGARLGKGKRLSVL